MCVWKISGLPVSCDATARSSTSSSGAKFVYTENDKLMRREEVLNDVTSGTDTVTAARNEGMEVHEFGAVTAAVTGWLIVEGRSKGAPFVHRYRFTDTWVKRKAGWEIVAAQDYLAPK